MHFFGAQRAWATDSVVVFYEDIRRVGGRATGRAKETIEAMIDGAIDDWLAEIDSVLYPLYKLARPVQWPVQINIMTGLQGPLEPDMPFADAGRFISVLLQQYPDCDLARLDQWGP